MRTKVDDGVASFFFSDGISPPHLHEVSGVCVIIRGEVNSTFKIRKKLRRAWPIGIPAPEDFFTIFDSEIGETGIFTFR